MKFPHIHRNRGNLLHAGMGRGSPEPQRVGQAAQAAAADNRAPQRAFTLVELLLVLVILGTLAAIVLPKFGGVGQRARVTAAQTQIATFKTALNNFEVDMGYYPKSMADLIQRPNGNNAQNWHGPYLDSDVIPPDPWGNAYVYTCPGKHNPSSFDIQSAGPDSQMGTDDDVCNWTLKR